MRYTVSLRVTDPLGLHGVALGVVFSACRETITYVPHGLYKSMTHIVDFAPQAPNVDVNSASATEVVVFPYSAK